MRHALWSRRELGEVPRLAAIDRYLHGLDGAPAGPGQPADLVESFAGQLLSAGRVRDDRLGSDLEAERRFFRILIEMPEVVTPARSRRRSGRSRCRMACGDRHQSVASLGNASEATLRPSQRPEM
jgi:hypothetical protein